MADDVRLTLPGHAEFADVAAETAATIALRLGFAGADVDRLRAEVTAAFSQAAGNAHGELAVDFRIDEGGVTVTLDTSPGVTIHLRRPGPA
jgi:hypothetical protein